MQHEYKVAGCQCSGACAARFSHVRAIVCKMRSRVGRSGHFAVHAVCRESVFWETLQELKGVGASAILVLPIEKMLP